MIFSLAEKSANFFTGVRGVYKKSGKGCQVLRTFQQATDRRNRQGKLFFITCTIVILKGLSHEIDFKNVDKK